MGEERNGTGTEDSDPYTESRRLWQEYLKGRITAEELERRLIRHAIREDIETIKDMFEAEEI